MTYWLSYGAGVNSTALAILLCEGKLPQYEPFRVLFADTRDEKASTYEYIEKVFVPYLDKYDRRLERTIAPESVIQRWERLHVTGSRLLRSCTREAKINPMERYKKEMDDDGPWLLGIDAGESHRRPDAIRPLVDLDIDRDECECIIQRAGLLVPVKSGCWHCPFLRVGQVMDLIRSEPCKAARIEKLEQSANEYHGGEHYQFGDHPIEWWRKRVDHGGKIVANDQGTLFEREVDPPCGCYDG